MQKPSFGKIYGIDHITIWVGNAKQAAAFYTSRFGFDYLMYRGLETGERDVVSHVIKSSDNVVLVFSSAYNIYCSQQMNEHLINHGDSVKDIAFHVQSSSGVYEQAIKNGAVPIRFPTKLQDKDGSVVISTVKSFGDTTHTFVERKKYKGPFLPGFMPHHCCEAVNKVFRPIRFEKIDNFGGVHGQFKMEEMVKYYEKCLGFHRFWMVDEKPFNPDHASLRLTVVTDFQENIKIKITETVAGKKKSHNHEFLQYFNGPGVQLISLRTENIIETVENMRVRGVDFLHVPDIYYDNLRKSLPEFSMKVGESIDQLQKNKILVDYDDKGYVLQAYTKSMEDRPTLFFQIIQRRNSQGFSPSNMKNLYLSLEQEQAMRGNLTEMI